MFPAMATSSKPRPSAVLVLMLATLISAAHAFPRLDMMSDLLAAKVRRARSEPVRRYMDTPEHFGEACLSGNCSAAHVATSASPTAPICPLVDRRPVRLNTTNLPEEVRNSNQFYPDEKEYFAHYGVHFEDTFETNSQQSQFPSFQYRANYYDPTRFPPIYNEWSCTPNVGTEAPAINTNCKLASSSNASAPVFGVCQHVCDYKLVLRLVDKSPSCRIPSSTTTGGSTSTEGRYVWAWCLESVAVDLYCAHSELPEKDLACTSSVTPLCHTFQDFASE